MEHQSILDQVRVASPCTARWEDMTGDDRSRFCRHCQKHVFNLSAMNRAEAEALIAEKEGKFCGRFHRRADGRMLTADCPVGRSTKRRRRAKFLAATLGLMGLMTSAVLGGLAQRSTSKGEFADRVDRWIYEVKVRLGITKPVIMGALCVPTPITVVPSNAPTIMGDIILSTNLPPPGTNLPTIMGKIYIPTRDSSTTTSSTENDQ
jgi:hypothetical protein